MYYYPFGMEMEGPWELAVSVPTNSYLYNGKERDKDFGLNWDHYGFRIYDATIARFTGVDPIADKFAHLSVYNYADNSPISNIDLHGLQAHRSINNRAAMRVVHRNGSSVKPNPHYNPNVGSALTPPYIVESNDASNITMTEATVSPEGSSGSAPSDVVEGSVGEFLQDVVFPNISNSVDDGNSNGGENGNNGGDGDGGDNTGSNGGDGDGGGGRTTIDESRAGHIFRTANGHVMDSATNRSLLENVANTGTNRLGPDRYGNM